MRGAGPIRTAGRLVRLVLLAYLGVLLVLSSMQLRMIFPGADSQGQPWAVARPPAGAELVALTTPQGERVTALFAPALSPAGAALADAPRRPTFLFFYGNGMCLAATTGLVESFRRLGVNVMVPDYLGYGMSGGSPSEAGCYAAADAALAHLRSRPDVDPRSIVAGGWSLGAAVAIDLAAREPVAGLVVFSGFTSMAAMARRVLPYLPTSLLLRHRFESIAKIGRVRVPTLIGHGDADSLIPLAMGDELARAAGGPVTRILVRGAEHNEFFDLGGEPFWAELARFFEAVPTGDGPD